MKNKITLIVFLLPILSVLFFSCRNSSQDEVPIIKATSLEVDIKDGNDFKKNVWRIVPEINPDIYTTSSKKVTFYTDIDSITFNVKPDKTYDFIILLNETDSAHTRIQYELGYLDKLKKAHKYNNKDNRYIPKFTYQAMTDENLVRLRKEFNLDSIAGQGNEISKIINLLYWVHDVVRHDGNSYNPSSQNAIDLINICKVENRGVNCRMMAAILNECYLSMGFKSRFVTCMPKETKFSDCHVINMVYVDSLQKWVWMDPTFCAYVTDETGELLGLSEVRERLINEKTLILNPDANWNKQVYQTKEGYLENYMAKNLYRMECLSVSEYNAETSQERMERIYVELLPLDGIEQQPQKIENTYNNYTVIKYKTNNPNIFWAKPE